MRKEWNVYIVNADVFYKELGATTKGSVPVKSPSIPAIFEDEKIYDSIKRQLGDILSLTLEGFEITGVQQIGK